MADFKLDLMAVRGVADLRFLELFTRNFWNKKEQILSMLE